MDELENQGFSATFAVPGTELSQHGYPGAAYKKLKSGCSHTKYIQNNRQFEKLIKSHDILLIGSWKGYRKLVKIAQGLGKKVVVFNGTSGLDYWPCGGDVCCVKGRFSKRQALYYQEKFDDFGSLKENQYVITGAPVHGRHDGTPLMDRNTFCAKYELNPDSSIAVLFPKGVGSFRKKIDIWFPDWNQTRKDEYNDRLLDLYRRICHSVEDAGWELIVKMHPTAYAEYMTDIGTERSFWDSISCVKTVEVEDTYDLYHHSRIGISVNSHSALDLNYLGKPFVYVDSNELPVPDLVPFHINHLSQLPLGPSTAWKEGGNASLNPWFPSWVGHFRRSDELSAYLASEFESEINPKDYDSFKDEFWGGTDLDYNEQIVTQVKRLLLP